jgi:hypothetical protein
MSLNLSNTHVFIVNERICRTVTSLERQAGACILRGKDIDIVCARYSDGVIVGTTSRSNAYARSFNTTDLVNICLSLSSTQCQGD